MANITEKEIIAFLKERILFHKNQSKWLEEVLSFISSKPESVAHFTKNNPSLIVPMSFPIKDKFQIKRPSQFNKALPIPEVYRPGLFINRKIAYALNVIKSGYKEDIADQIIALQPEVNKTQILKQLSTVLSKLKSQKLLIAIKEGRKYRYSLPQQQE